MKDTLIKLESPTGRQESFRVEHAERILRLSNNGGWRLADKGYKFNGLSITKITPSKK